MDNSPGSDPMDWEQDSSLHIIQPASSPWRKRSFDTYNDTNEPYRPNHVYSPYRPTDVLAYEEEVPAPSLNVNGQPAQYGAAADGNVILEPIIQPQPRPPIGSHLPECIKWLIYGATLLFCGSVELAGGACIHTATVAMRVGNTAKRRLVEVTKKTFATTPPPRRQRHSVSHRRKSPIIRRVSPPSPGGRTHIPVTPPRARTRATLTEAVTISHDCVVDYVPSNVKYVRSGAFVSTKDEHLMSGFVHYPYYEPLMSGALQDIETKDIDIDEGASANVTPNISLQHIPGTFPCSPAPPVLLSTEIAAPESQSGHDPPSPHDLNLNEPASSDAQAADDAATSSEASEEPDIPDVQPNINFSLHQVDRRPRNYKGELLDDWQIKICKEFQAIHPPPREVQRQATKVPEQPHGMKATGLIDSYRSPLADAYPIPPGPQIGTTATGSSDSRRSPLASIAQTGANEGIMDLHRIATDHLGQPRGMSSVGLNDLYRSPSDLSTAASESLKTPLAPTSIGLNDLYRSPLDLHKATPETLHPSRAINSKGLSDVFRSSLAVVSPKRAGDILNDSVDQTSGTSHELPKMENIESINSPPSPLPALSSIDLPCGTNSVELTDFAHSPMDGVSPIHIRLRTSPIESDSPPVSSLVASPMGAAGDAVSDTHVAALNVSKNTQFTAPVALRSPAIPPSSTITTAPAKSPSRWSIRSLYARVQGKPKKRSPLCERVNNGNIYKVPKTPKKVTWPANGPVTGTKRYVKNEAMSHPSPTSSREDSSILSSVPSDFSAQTSPSMQLKKEGAALKMPYQVCSPNSIGDDSKKNNVLNPASTTEHTGSTFRRAEERIINSSSSSDNEASVHLVRTPTKAAAADPSTPPSQLSSMLEELSVSTRRSSLRQREKEDQAQKLRAAIAAEEKARREKKEAEEKARREKKEAEEKARKDKEEAEEKARIKAEEEEKRKLNGGYRMPIEKVIQPLPLGWDEKVRVNMAKGMRERLAMTSVGNPLTRRDFGMVLPQPGTGDDPSGWLNDEIISGYLQAVVDHGHRALGHPRGAKPRMHAFSPFFYTTLKDRGYDAVKRWSSRAKIGGSDLKNVEYVFIPCNPTRAHWTMVIVSPIRKTIEVFDSMHGASSDKVNTTKSWLRGEMGHAYVDSEWTVIEDPRYPGRGKGPLQNNANDCGVFAVTTAKMLVLGVDPMAVSAGDMPLQRRRLVAELLNGGFSGEFEPRIVFE